MVIKLIMTGYLPRCIAHCNESFACTWCLTRNRAGVSSCLQCRQRIRCYGSHFSGLGWQGNFQCRISQQVEHFRTLGTVFNATVDGAQGKVCYCGVRKESAEQFKDKTSVG